VVCHLKTVVEQDSIESLNNIIIIILVPQASPIPRARNKKLMKKIKVWSIIIIIIIISMQ